MVQRHIDEDLGNRFSRIEQVKFERHRREKFDSPENNVTAAEMNVVGVGGGTEIVSPSTDRCRRVLFEPDTNLLGWINGELTKIASNDRTTWNFDFRRETPAGIVGHKWQWERVDNRNSADGSSLQRPTPIRPTAVKTATNWTAGSRVTKILKPSTVTSSQKKLQKKITDYLQQRKYQRTGPTSKSLPISVPMETSNASSTVNSPSD